MVGHEDRCAFVWYVLETSGLILLNALDRVLTRFDMIPFKLNYSLAFLLFNGRLSRLFSIRRRECGGDRLVGGFMSLMLILAILGSETEKV